MEDIVLRDGTVELTEAERIVVPVVPNVELVIAVEYPDTGLSPETKANGHTFLWIYQSNNPDGSVFVPLPDCQFGQEDGHALSTVPFTWLVKLTPTEPYLVLDLVIYNGPCGYPKVTAQYQIMSKEVYDFLMAAEATITEEQVAVKTKTKHQLEDKLVVVEQELADAEAPLAVFLHFEDEMAQYELVNGV